MRAAERTRSLDRDEASMHQRLLSIKEFGHVFGPKHTKTYELIKRGELTAVKVGRRTYIPIEAAEAWAAGLPRL